MLYFDFSAYINKYALCSARLDERANMIDCKLTTQTIQREIYTFEQFRRPKSSYNFLIDEGFIFCHKKCEFPSFLIASTKRSCI